MSAADVMDKLIEGGQMVEAMKLVTGSEKHIDKEQVETVWEDVPYSAINEGWWIFSPVSAASQRLPASKPT